MNRRAMVILPGIALAAGSRLAQAQEPPTAGSGKLSHKAMSKFTRLKSFSSIPKSAAKQAKYVNFFTALLSLTSNQKTQAATIFASAAASHAAVKQNVKAARQALSEAVKANDGAGIVKESAAIGTLKGQYHVIGANAHATFFQILTSEQQARFSQFRG
jgi:Spy/CpxP family protein refolding chaperone